MRYLYYLTLLLLALPAAPCERTEYPIAKKDGVALDPALQYAYRYEGYKEGRGNRGTLIKEMGKAARLGYRDRFPYCAGFVSMILDESGTECPTVRTAAARRFIVRGSISAKRVYEGSRQLDSNKTYIVVWGKGGTAFGHVGFGRQTGKNKFETIEANTSSGKRGSQRDGGGIYKRERSIRPTAYFRIIFFTEVSYAKGDARRLDKYLWEDLKLEKYIKDE